MGKPAREKKELQTGIEEEIKRKPRVWVPRSYTRATRGPVSLGAHRHALRKPLP